MMEQAFKLPAKLQPVMKKAKLLEVITLIYLLSVVIIIYAVMGSSQAMKAAWLEDLLSLFPAFSFLVASRINTSAPSDNFPFGFHRIFSIAFFGSALALLAMGIFLVGDSAMTLVKQEHPGIGTVVLFDQQFWMGWLMIMALLYSLIPALILGRMKLPLAEKLHNKVLYTDAETQKADYMTAGAAIIGVLGIGLGFWWTDAVAALFIGFSVTKDGIKQLSIAVTDLMDRQPMTVDNSSRSPLLYEIRDEFARADWIESFDLRVREMGQMYFVEVFVQPAKSTDLIKKITAISKKVEKLNWRIKDVLITPVEKMPKER